MPDASPVARIRPAAEGDLAAFLALLRHLNPDDPHRTPEEAARTWAGMLASPLVTVLFAELPDGTLAASCTMVTAPNLTAGLSSWVVIENVVTHADHRRQGHGHAVLAEAVARARAAGCYKVMLATGSTNPGTHRFYQEAGFKGGGKTHYELRLAHPRPSSEERGRGA